MKEKEMIVKRRIFVGKSIQGQNKSIGLS